jgi:hypothetical protein
MATTSSAGVLNPRIADTVPSCSGLTTDVWLNTQGNGTAGTIYYKLEFTNFTTKSCTFSGFPGVSAVSIFGKQVGAPARRDGSAKTVTLKPGATAYAMLGIIFTSNFPVKSCAPTTAAGLRVYPPNSTQSWIDWFPFSVCGKTSEVSLSIAAVV